MLDNNAFHDLCDLVGMTMTTMTGLPVYLNNEGFFLFYIVLASVGPD